MSNMDQINVKGLSDEDVAQIEAVRAVRGEGGED